METQESTATGQLTNPHKRIEGINTVNGIVHFKPGQTRTVTITEAQGERAMKLGFVPVIDANVDQTTDPVKTPVDREDIKKQADELGLDYAKNIPTDKLKEMIDAKLAD